MHKIRLIIMSLLVLLPSSSFYWQSYFLNKLSQGTFTQKELILAAKINALDVIYSVFQQTKKYQQLWFQSAYILAQSQGEIAVELAEFFNYKQEPEQALIWYQQAVKLHNITGVKALALIQYYQGNYFSAIELLEKYLSQNDVLVVALELAIAEGDEKRISSWLPKLLNSAHNESFYQELVRFNIAPISAEKTAEIAVENKAKLCDISIDSLSVNSSTRLVVNSVALFATSLKDLRHTEYLVTQFAKHPLAEFFCFSSISYQPKNSLACSYSQDQPISCNESLFPLAMTSTEARFIGIVLPDGGANVHNGTLYLDGKDDENVFAHELAHLLGFIDEYPLKSTHDACQQPNNILSHNVVVLPKTYNASQTSQANLRADIINKIPWGKFILNSTPIMVYDGVNWVLGTPDEFSHSVGVFPAKTCEKTAQFSFKPLQQRTQLEYFEIEFPKLYQQLYLQQPTRFLMQAFNE